MKELTRFEMAVVKRTAQNTKSLRTKRDKLVAKISACQVELESINTMIEKFEQPIKEMTGGYTSEEVLNGIPELQAESVVLGEEESKESEPVPTETVETEESTNVEDDEFPFPMLDKE